VSDKLSEGKINSTKKSGQKGKNVSLCSGVKFFHFSIGIDAVSGERLAPFERLKRDDQSKGIPS